MPPPPDNLQRIAFHGISLMVPADTNLAFHSGTRLKGAMLFNNLTSRQLEIRWQTPRGILPLHRRDPYKALDRTIARLRKKNKIEKLAANAFRIAAPIQTLFLIADAKRIYELTFPTPLPEFHPTVIEDFLTATPPLALADHWPWQIYGIRGTLPRHAQLTAASFLPGSSHLSFRHQKTKTDLASHSLADRLLQNRSLTDWATATFPFLKKITTPQWQTTATTTTLGHPPHTLTIEHIPPLNLIRSQHKIQK